MRFSDNSSAAFKPLGSGVSRRVEPKDAKRKASQPVYVKKANLALPPHSLRLLESGYTILLRNGTSVRKVKVGAITKYQVL